MKPTAFGLEQLTTKASAAKKTDAKRPAVKRKAASKFPKTTPWAKEFLKRVDALRKALDGQQLS